MSVVCSIEDLVEDIGRVTNRRRDDLRPVLRVLVRGPGVESEAPSEAEIFRERGRVLRRASNGESLAIGGGEGSTAPGLGKRQLVLEVHESREGSFERLLARVPVRGPCELAVGQIGDVGPRREAEVAGLGQDRRVHVAHQIRISRSSPTGVPEELREPGPGVDLDQDFRQLHPWQAFGNEVVQLNEPRRATPPLKRARARSDPPPGAGSPTR